MEPTANTNKPASFLKVFAFVVLVAIVAAGSYYLGMRDTSLSQVPTEEKAAVVTPENAYLKTVPAEALGYTTWSFAKGSNGVYIKEETRVTNPKAKYSNTTERSFVHVYSPDKTYEPEKVTVDPSAYTWTGLVTEPVMDTPGAEISVDDKLFNFAYLPGTDSFLLTLDVMRFVGDITPGLNIVTVSSPYQNQRDLYFYNAASGKLKLVHSFVEHQGSEESTYPRISTFSQDGKYVSFHLFGCWSCGGGMPSTLLLNIDTFELKNIGQVFDFAWKANGEYQYKDYSKIPCTEDAPGNYPDSGGCYKDPKTLPLKTGKF